MKQLIVSVLFFNAIPAFAQVQQHQITIYEHKKHDSTSRFINAMEAGQRARYYREQMELIELQKTAYSLQLRQAEFDQKERERAARLAAARAPATAQPQTAQVITAAQQAEIVERTNIELALFTAKYPDWKTIEKEMMHFASRLEPKNMSEQEYLEVLYVLAKSFFKK